MKLAPRYDGPPILVIDGEPECQLAPCTRQRVRFQDLLSGLTTDQWNEPSRCDGWSVRDVIAHLITVNQFWDASVVAGVAGEPTRILTGFDPAATPPAMVSTMSALSSEEVLDGFVDSNAALLETLSGLTRDEWSMTAESPAGHVPIRLLVQHGIWDSWVHERDVALPLGLQPVVEPDEVVSCLQYAAAVSPALGIGLDRSGAGVLAVDATGPSVRFVLEVSDCVVLRDGSIDDDIPCLRGDAVELTEALSLRVPLDAAAPMEWRQALGGIEAAFDAV
jgi:uncharacterized protein (TIGR03083 family)